MKKYLTVVLFLIMLAITCQAQRIYSKENLEKVSSEDLNLYYGKAKKMKKTGNIITLTGSCTAVTGIVLIALNSESTAYFGLYMLMAGIGTTVIGIPILITGSTRVKNIEAIKYAHNDGVKIDLAPSGIYNYASQNYQPGITLRIRF